MSACRSRAIVLASSILFVLPSPLSAFAADAGDDVPRPLDLRTAVRIAGERSQAASAARSTAAASRAMADAEDRLPDPEIMADAWQIPVRRPLAIDEGMMLSVSVRQTIPAPGSRSARSAAYEADARATDAIARDRSRAVEREAAHAFVDVEAAEARHAQHAAHRDVAARLVTLAEKRLASGAVRLAEVAQAEVERAKLDADVALEGALVEKARARLNTLLRRRVDAALETTPLGAPTAVVLDTNRTIALAESTRPELATVRARRAADDAGALAASREATWPSFTVGAGWFAPTMLMPFHGYGVTLGATLPWIWGSASARARAGEARSMATQSDEAELASRIRTEVATAVADVRAASLRLSVLRSRAKPAADSALNAALSAYESGQGELAALLRAERDVVEIDLAVVDARAQLEHALAELDWAVGAPVARVPLADAVAAEGGRR